MKKKPFIIIAGPTAAGKTELSVQLALKIGGEIISADSMQVYKGFDIGTAKIRTEEMKGVPHYLIDVLEAEDAFHVCLFQKMAKEAMNRIYQVGHIPILVGGTGFYIQSVLYDISFTEEETDLSYRKELEELAKTEGAEVLHRRLKEVDPLAAKEIHPNNVKRVIRALEFQKETGAAISQHNKEQRSRPSPYNFAFFVLNRSRPELYERINRRVDLMIREGLVPEVQALLDSGISRDALSMQGLGYKEIVKYLDGEWDFETAVSKLKQGTRHFAKRQITWFKREKDAIWMNYEDFTSTDAMLMEMMRILKEKQIL